jgi:hypothetical protein
VVYGFQFEEPHAVPFRRYRGQTFFFHLRPGMMQEGGGSLVDAGQ